MSTARRSRTSTAKDEKQSRIEKAYGVRTEPTEVAQLKERVAQLEQMNRMLRMRVEPMPADAASKVDTSAKSVVTGAKEPKGRKASAGEKMWQLETWLRSLPLAAIIARALLKHLSEAAGKHTEGLEQAFLNEMATTGSEATFLAVLKEALVPEELADTMFQGACRVVKQRQTRSAGARAQKGSSASESEEARISAFTSKFVDDGAKTLVMGHLEDFYGGLDKLVGQAQSLEVATLAAEHTSRDDAERMFEVGNYGTRTASLVEWAFVAEPQALSSTRLRRLLQSGEFSMGDVAGAFPREVSIDSEAHRRKLLTIGSYSHARAECDTKLMKLGLAPVSDTEFVSARLYTGPMYLKYNAVLRAAPGLSRPLSEFASRLCQGNKYETTLHGISAAIQKLGSIQRSQALYRAPGGVLPEEFLRFDEYNLRGGVEFAFMSASADREVAIEYATRSPAGIIFQINQPMADRGADLSWLSQYPHEQEVTFPAITSLEVRDQRIEGSVVVIELTPRISQLQATPWTPDHAAKRAKKTAKSSVCTVM